MKMEEINQDTAHDLKGGQITIWIEAHREEIVKSVEKEGLWVTCDRFGIGHIALQKHLQEWGYDKNFGLDFNIMPVAPPKYKPSLEEEVAALQARNERLEEEIDNLKQLRMLVKERKNGNLSVIFQFGTRRLK